MFVYVALHSTAVKEITR